MKFTCFVFAFFYCINIIINEIYTIIFKKCTKEQVCALTKITILNSGPMFQTFLKHNKILKLFTIHKLNLTLKSRNKWCGNYSTRPSRHVASVIVHVLVVIISPFIIIIIIFITSRLYLPVCITSCSRISYK